MPTLDGGCHCGTVRFRVTFDAYEAIDCNCSICTMKGILHIIVPEKDFEILKGADALTTYTFNTGVAKHMFCKTCGIHAFYRPRSHPDSWDVNVRCLDDHAVDEFTRVPFNGRQWEDNVHAIR